MDGITDSGDGEGQRGLVCCSPLHCKESDTTEQLNNTLILENSLQYYLIALALTPGFEECFCSLFFFIPHSDFLKEN